MSSLDEEFVIDFSDDEFDDDGNLVIPAGWVNGPERDDEPEQFGDDAAPPPETAADGPISALTDSASDWAWDDNRDKLPDVEHEKAVAHEVERMRVREDARRVYRAEVTPAEQFDAGLLSEILARAPEPAPRIEDFLPWEGGMLWTAQRKAGKTIGALNAARALITGDDFLGTKKVRPIAMDQRVGFLNFEVSASKLAQWADEVGVPADRLFVVNLRGKRNPFKTEADLARLGLLLRAARVVALIVDPFGKAFDGDDQNNNTQVTGWFDRLDVWARGVVGALDVIVTAHAGKNGEGFRGASAAEGWADSIVTMTKQGDTRFIAVEGRDVELPESALAFDKATRQLTLVGGTRADSAQDGTLETIERLLTAAAVPMSGRAIEEALDGMAGRDEVRAALKQGERKLRLSWQVGPKNAHLWTVLQAADLVTGGGDDGK